MSVYNFRAGPTYRGATSQEMMAAAIEMPMSRTSTFFDQAGGGVLESFGLGTALRDIGTPEGDVERNRFAPNEALGVVTNPLVHAYRITKDLAQALINDDESPTLSEDAYKSSAWYRQDIPWDQAMTEQRAAALARSFDAKKVREFYAEKRPITAFIGNLAGQATDPINYIPIAGPAVKAAAAARLGKVAGASVAASLDAAANTAIFGLATAGARSRYGDDVSWQTTVSQIATAALIGAGFGAIGGALGRRTEAVSRSAIEERLATLKTTQEARIALNEGIDALVHGEDVRLSPNATEPLARVQREIIAYHGSPHVFDNFSMDRIGTGEGAQSFGHGLYFAESPVVAQKYREDLALPSTPENDVAKAYLRQAGGDTERAVALVEAYGKETGQDLSAVVSNLRENTGAFYEVAIRADREEFLDYDKPLKEQSEKVRAGLERAFGEETTDPAFFRNSDTNTGDWLDMAAGLYAKDKKELAERLRQAGLPGIQYLDAGSRDGGGGTRNFVLFDDALVSIRARNGVPVDTTPARADQPPEGIADAEKAVAKPDDYKALSNQYRVDPETGAFSEDADIAQLAAEGRLTEDDAAVLADAKAIYDDGAAYGEALKSVAGCLI